jgi:hypothetical protein
MYDLNAADTNESWPGPFATAYAIMEKRAEAKKAREDAINAAKSIEANETSGISSDEEVDLYEAALSTLSWSPSFPSITKVLFRLGVVLYVSFIVE